MNKRTIHFAIFLLSAVLISFEALTNSSGAPAGSTGSPQSNGNTCMQSGCHSGGPAVSTQTIVITHDIPAAGFQPNTDYDFTVTATSGAFSSSKIGFQLSIESGDGHEGTLSTNGSSALLKSGAYLGHSFNGTQATAGVRVWNFMWNSGNAPDGTNVYVACNFSNNNNTNTGDVIATKTLSLTKDQSVSVAEKKIATFQIFPNPANNVVNIEGLSEEVSGIDILTPDGKHIQSISTASRVEEGRWRCEINSLPAGNYILVPQGAVYSPQKITIVR